MDDVEMAQTTGMSVTRKAHSTRASSFDTYCCHMGTAIISKFWYPGTLMLSPGRQCAQMSKISNDSLTRSGTGCFSIWQQWASKG